LLYTRSSGIHLEYSIAQKQINVQHYTQDYCWQTNMRALIKSPSSF
jgi:hypothetical protein